MDGGPVMGEAHQYDPSNVTFASDPSRVQTMDGDQTLPMGGQMASQMEELAQNLRFEDPSETAQEKLGRERLMQLAMQRFQPPPVIGSMPSHSLPYAPAGSLKWPQDALNAEPSVVPFDLQAKR